MNEIIIKPFDSIGYYKLNSSKGDIEKKYGESKKIVTDNIVGNIIEYRDALELTYIKSRSVYKLESVTCSAHTTPIIHGVDVYKEGLEALKKIDANFIEGPQYITFKTLGVSIGGMGSKKIPEKRLVIAFRKDRLNFYELFPTI